MEECANTRESVRSIESKTPIILLISNTAKRKI